jgi:hypothetical protein
VPCFLSPVAGTLVLRDRPRLSHAQRNEPYACGLIHLTLWRPPWAELSGWARPVACAGPRRRQDRPSSLRSGRSILTPAPVQRATQSTAQLSGSDNRALLTGNPFTGREPNPASWVIGAACHMWSCARSAALRYQDFVRPRRAAPLPSDQIFVSKADLLSTVAVVRAGGRVQSAGSADG